MLQITRKIKSAGISIVELIVSVGVFSIILLSLSMIVSAGYNYYWENAGSLEVQKAVLYGTRLLNEDLTQSNSESVEIRDIPAQPFPLDRIVFASPDDQNGQRSYNSRGQLQWQSYVGYYVAPLGNSQALYRSTRAVPTPGIAVPSPSADGITPDSMSLLQGPRLILKDINQFDLEMPEQHLIKIRMTGFFQQRGFFSITVENQVLPRN